MQTKKEKIEAEALALWSKKGNATYPAAVFVQSLNVQEKYNFLDFCGKKYSPVNKLEVTNSKWGSHVGWLNRSVIEAFAEIFMGEANEQQQVN